MLNDFVELDDHFVVLIKWKDRELKMLIDKDDFYKLNEKANTVHAQFSKYTNSFYAIFHVEKDGKRSNYQVHRFIFKPEEIKGKVVDHKNHETLDNRRSNLLPCSRSKNGQNRSGANSNSKTGLRNITWCKEQNKWRVSFMYKRKMIFVGRFDSLNEAKLAYEKRLEELKNA